MTPQHGRAPPASRQPRALAIVPRTMLRCTNWRYERRARARNHPGARRRHILEASGANQKERRIDDVPFVLRAPKPALRLIEKVTGTTG
jgi:hypothetical protein